MPGLHGPLFSLGATGRLSRALTLARRLAGPGWLLRGRPADPRTQAQITWRTMWQLAASLWHDLSAAEQAAWETAGTIHHMTGFAWYMSQALRPNPGIYLPLAGGKMSGDIDMDGNTVEDLPAPAAPNDAARKAYVDAITDEHSFMYWRRLNRYHFSNTRRISVAATPNANELHAVPFYTPAAVTLTRIGIQVTAGVGGNARLGIYQDDGTVYPGALLSDCGVVVVADAGAKEILGLSVPLDANTLYWLVYLSDVAPTVLASRTYSGWHPIGSATPHPSSMSGTWQRPFAYAPLPNPFGAAGNAIGQNIPMIGAYLT